MRPPADEAAVLSSHQRVEARRRQTAAWRRAEQLELRARMLAYGAERSKENRSLHVVPHRPAAVWR